MTPMVDIGLLDVINAVYHISKNIISALLAVLEWNERRLNKWQ